MSRVPILVTIVLQDHTLKQVTSFKYLGSSLFEKGLIDIEINEEISQVSQNVSLLYRPLEAFQRKLKELICRIITYTFIWTSRHGTSVLSKRQK